MKQVTLQIDKETKQQLQNYNRLDSTQRGNLAEKIVILFLNNFKYNYEILKNKQFQKLFGDFAVINKDNNIKYIEVKNSHTFFKQNKDKLALDYRYYVKNTKTPYFQSGSIDNKGYLEYIKCDILIAFNNNNNKLYIISKFQEVKNNILKLIQDYDEDFKSIEYITDLEFSNKQDSCKDSTIINLNLNEKSIERLGGKLTEFEIKYNLSNKKILPTNQSKSILKKRIK